MGRVGSAREILRDLAVPQDDDMEGS